MDTKSNQLDTISVRNDIYSKPVDKNEGSVQKSTPYPPKVRKNE
jgi:hypothetical protein